MEINNLSQIKQVTNEPKRVENSFGIDSFTKKYTEQIKNQKIQPELDDAFLKDLELKIKNNANLNINLSFDIDKESGKRIVKIIDVQSKEVLRQIPSEEALKISRSIENFFDYREKLQKNVLNPKGVLVDIKG